MSSEDDTFNRLRRCPYDELILHMQNSDIFETPVHDPYPPNEVALLEEHGWTELDFKKTYRDLMVGRLEHYDWYPLFLNNIRWLENKVKNDRR